MKKKNDLTFEELKELVENEKNNSKFEYMKEIDSNVEEINQDNLKFEDIEEVNSKFEDSDVVNDLDNPEIEENEIENLDSTSNKKNKKLIVKLTAIATSLAVVLTGLVIGLVKKNKKEDTKEKVTDDYSYEDLSNISDLGIELTTSGNEQNQYGKTTGNVDKSKIVEKNGEYYVDQEAADKSSSVGKTSIDTKNDTLTVKNDKVYNNESGNIVVDSSGKTVSSGTSSVPNGYSYDSNLNKTIKTEEVGKYVYCDANYYDGDTLILQKGDVVSKETLEKAKKELSTVKGSTTTKESTTKETTTKETTTKQTTTKETTTKESTTKISNGKVNNDGTYTINGLTFKTKADYEQWIIQGYSGYSILDGIMISDEEIKELINSYNK